MKGRKVLAGLLAVSMLLGTAACGSEDSASKADDGEKGASAGEPLRVGTMPLAVGIPVLWAQEKGYFEEAGLNIDLELFSTGAPINEAIAADQLDIAVSGFASIYSLANDACTWLADVSCTGGNELYARADSPIAQGEKDGVVGNADALKGAKVLVQLGTSQQYMVESYAEQFGLAPEDINEVNMEIAAAYQAFSTGEGDIIAANAPYSYTLGEEGYVKLCDYSTATKERLVDGCFARNEVVEDRGEEVQLFVNCLVKAVDDLCKDKEARTEFTRQVYTDNGISFEEENLAKEIDDTEYVGTEMMQGSDYVFGEHFPGITEFLVKAEKITADNAPNVVKSLDASFVSEAVGAEIKAAE